MSDLTADRTDWAGRTTAGLGRNQESSLLRTKSEIGESSEEQNIFSIFKLPSS